MVEGWCKVSAERDDTGAAGREIMDLDQKLLLEGCPWIKGGQLSKRDAHSVRTAKTLTLRSRKSNLTSAFREADEVVEKQ